MRRTTLLIIATIFLCFAAKAQDTVEFPKQWEHSVKLGLGLGASSPIPIPNRISEMSWTPYLSYLGEYNLRYSIGENTGIKAGLQIRHQGMTAEAKVYQMFTQAEIEDAEVSGYFSGYNETNINATYLSLPILFSYKLNKDWSLDAGVFLALKIQGYFGGAVKNGYIRIDTPTGDKAEVGYETFEFSQQLNPFNYGIELSTERTISQHWACWFDLTWALNSTFKDTFRGLEYKMYNIYGFLGIAYKL
ncbi:MAG: PorT family protein [Bacteroidales bacterium]|nr:PorT family protein [Bacteroidales bacterium]MBR5029353.1 PorT family protein [Bacteroidales bacterium]